MGNVLKRYNGTSWEPVGGTITGDTLPIGSIVEFDGASIPVGWEEVSGTNKIKKVSQVAGLIDAIEVGSNTNGNWIKYSDGTMICYKKASATNVAITSSWGSLYEGSFSLGSWPQTFTDVPNIQVSNAGATGFIIESFAGGDLPTASSAGSLLVVRPTSATTSCSVYLTAIGKWK